MMTTASFLTVLVFIFALVICCHASSSSHLLDQDSVAFTGTWERGTIVTLSFTPAQPLVNTTLILTNVNANTTAQSYCQPSAAPFLTHTHLNSTFAAPERYARAREEVGTMSCHVENGFLLAKTPMVSAYVNATSQTSAGPCDIVLTIGQQALVPGQHVHCYFRVTGGVEVLGGDDYSVVVWSSDHDNNNNNNSTTSPQILPSLTKAITAPYDAQWIDGVHTFGDTTASHFVFNTTSPFPQHLPWHVVLSFVNANLPPNYAFQVSNLPAGPLGEFASAWCGVEGVRLLIRGSTVHLFTDTNPPTNFTCIIPMQPYSADSLTYPTKHGTWKQFELQHDVGQRVSHGFSTRLVLTTVAAIPLDFPDFRSAHIDAVGGEELVLETNWVDYYVYQQVRYHHRFVLSRGVNETDIVLKVNNITDNFFNFAAFDDYFGTNNWSLWVECDVLPYQPNNLSPQTHKVTASLNATFDGMGVLHFDPTTIPARFHSCYIKFEAASPTYPPPFSMHLSIGESYKVLKMYPWLLPLDTANTHISLLNNTHFAMLLPLHQDGLLSLPEGFVGVETFHAVDINPQYTWLDPENHNFTCALLNITLNSTQQVVENTNNTLAKLIRAPRSLTRLGGTTGFTYHLWLSANVTGDHVMNVECTGNVSPLPKFTTIRDPEPYSYSLSSVSVYIYGESGGSLGLAYDLPPPPQEEAPQEPDGWMMHSYFPAPPVCAFAITTEEQYLPATPAELLEEFVELMNTPFNTMDEATQTSTNNYTHTYYPPHLFTLSTLLNASYSHLPGAAWGETMLTFPTTPTTTTPTTPATTPTSPFSVDGAFLATQAGFSNNLRTVEVYLNVSQFTSQAYWGWCDQKFAHEQFTAHPHYRIELLGYATRTPLFVPLTNVGWDMWHPEADVFRGLPTGAECTLSTQCTCINNTCVDTTTWDGILLTGGLKVHQALYGPGDAAMYNGPELDANGRPIVEEEEEPSGGNNGGGPGGKDDEEPQNNTAVIGASHVYAMMLSVAVGIVCTVMVVF